MSLFLRSWPPRYAPGLGAKIRDAGRLSRPESFLPEPEVCFVKSTSSRSV